MMTSTTARLNQVGPSHYLDQILQVFNTLSFENDIAEIDY